MTITLPTLAAFPDPSDRDNYQTNGAAYHASLRAVVEAIGALDAEDFLAGEGNLIALSGLTLAAGKLLKATGPGALAQIDLGAFGETLAAAVDGAAARSSLAVYSQAEVDAAISAAVGAVSAAPAFVLEDQRTSGTAGGAASTSWSQRPLQTVVRNVASAVSLSSNQFTPAVDCWVEFEAVMYVPQRGQVRLYNTTDAVSVGLSHVTHPNSNPTAVAARGGAALTAGKTYEIQDIVSTSHDSNDRGVAGSFGTEVYARVVGWVI